MIDVGDSVALTFPVGFAPTSVSVTVTAPSGAVTLGAWTSGGGPTGSIVITVAGTTATASVTVAAAGVHQVAWSAGGAGGAAAALRDVIVVADPAMVAGIGLEDLRAHLGASVRATDDRLRQLARVATTAAEGYTGLWLYPRVAVETHTGGRRVLVLRHAPLVSVTSVTIDGVTVTGDVRRSPGGMLYHPSGSWPDSDPHGITVTYVAGAYPSVDQSHGLLELARHLWDTQRGGSQLPRQAGAGDEWDPRAAFSVPRRVAELLDGGSDVGLG